MFRQILQTVNFLLCNLLLSPFFNPLKFKYYPQKLVLNISLISIFMKQQNNKDPSSTDTSNNLQLLHFNLCFLQQIWGQYIVKKMTANIFWIYSAFNIIITNTLMLQYGTVILNVSTIHRCQKMSIMSYIQFIILMLHSYITMCHYILLIPENLHCVC